MKIFKELNEIAFSNISLNQFYGIELDDFAHVVAHRHVVRDCDVLQRFDDSALRIPRLRGLDRRVNQTNTTRHRVKEHFMGRQPIDVGVLDKATCCWGVVVFAEMRQGA